MSAGRTWTLSGAFPGGALGPSGSGSAGGKDLQACLQRNGFKVGAGKQPDFSDPAFVKAMQSCTAYLPQRGIASRGAPPGFVP